MMVAMFRPSIFLLILSVCYITILAACATLPKTPDEAVFDLQEDSAKEGQLDGPLLSTTSVWSWDRQLEPVLHRGPSGTWDAVDVLNPTIVFVEGVYYNLYSGYDGSRWQTGLATSLGGINWRKFEGNPVLRLSERGWDSTYIAANGSVAHADGTFYYWYQGGEKAQIGVATSKDARAWDRLAEPVLKPGPKGSWDDTGVADPAVIHLADTFYMYYLGMDSYGVQRLGVARSNDGRKWEKSIANPILDVGPPGYHDENGLGEPAVFRVGQRFYMLYTGRNASEVRTQLLATSPDGVHWMKKLRGPVLDVGPSNAWDSAVVADAWPMIINGQLLVWYGGGNRKEPAQNLNGAIGLARTGGPQVIVDFTALTGSARIQPETRRDDTPNGKYVFSHAFERAGEKRESIVTIAGGSIGFPVVAVPPDAALAFAIAMPWDIPPDGGFASIEFVAEDGQRLKIYSRWLAPAKNEDERRWNEEQISITSLAGRRGSFVFSASPAQSGDITGLWIGWSNPRMVTTSK